MAEIDVKKGTDREDPKGRGESGGTTAGAAGAQGGRQSLASTRGRQGTGLAREGEGWGWPSRSAFGLSPMDLWTASPFELMRRMSQEMDRMLLGAPGSGAGAMGWMPPVEVEEREGKLVVKAELPGLSQDDVRLEATDEGLVIEGERRREVEDTSGGVYRSERSYGSFRRVIPLPEDAQVEQAEARFHDGLLEVTVPVPEQSARRRRIPIGSGSGEPGPGRTSGTRAGSGDTARGAGSPREEDAGPRRRG